ncbi:unnamed protein product [Arctia plantaginis]|uniref:Uncharacterized protein n=1 Tax=Arctia plantaginis TaxID=874455 RepID=A0A8S1ADV8_ARCPL|nr:unnamed protein product [Arctia plantaginis]
MSAGKLLHSIPIGRVRCPQISTINLIKCLGEVPRTGKVRARGAVGAAVRGPACGQKCRGQANLFAPAFGPLVLIKCGAAQRRRRTTPSGRRLRIQKKHRQRRRSGRTPTVVCYLQVVHDVVMCGSILFFLIA